jgi:peroxiredoxin
MTQFESRRPEIEAAGAQLAFIAAEKRSGIWRPAKFFEKHPIASVFLLDENRTVTKTYGLYHRLGKDAIHIAHPATLVIDRSGLLRYIYRGDDQSDRAPLQEVLSALVGL